MSASSSPSSQLSRFGDEIRGITDWKNYLRKIVDRSNDEKERLGITRKEWPGNPFNRYSDVVPYDNNRVRLRWEDSHIDSDYINASKVGENNEGKTYILMQGPLKETVEHVWQMIYQESIHTVIMLCQLCEKDVEKCYQYWPEAENPFKYKKSHLDVRFIKEDNFVDYSIKTLALSHQNTPRSTRLVKLIQYRAWPDFDVPNNISDFLAFLSKVNEIEDESSAIMPRGKKPPTVVHCSAGIGRSGCYILVDWILDNYIKTGELEFEDVIDKLIQFRTYRDGLIQTHYQLQFTLKAIYKGIKELVGEEKSSKSTVQSTKTIHKNSVDKESNISAADVSKVSHVKRDTANDKHGKKVNSTTVEKTTQISKPNNKRTSTGERKDQVMENGVRKLNRPSDESKYC